MASHKGSHAITTALTRLAITLLAVLLTACGATTDPGVCQQLGENLLQDANFALEEQDGRSKSWGALQHAVEKSFEFTVENGELTITKIGTQPWGIFRQRLRTSELGGARMAFTAELKMDLSSNDSRLPTTGGGLNLTALSGNNKVLLQSRFNHEPRLGKTDWQAVRVIVDIPETT
ncbi:MAG: hypothetical protein V2I26_09085 [Halieaceae bacterium]|jgi:hypothetical protein|nr:hypothetical protein [Halieaceae bacterium]